MKILEESYLEALKKYKTPTGYTFPSIQEFIAFQIIWMLELCRTIDNHQEMFCVIGTKKEEQIDSKMS